MRRILPIGCLLLLLGACSGILMMELQRAELRTDRTSYTIGEEGTLTLENTGAEAIYHGVLPCFAFVERRLDGEWTDAGQYGEICILPLFSTAPGEERVREFSVGDLFSPGGEYRFTFNVRDREGEDRTIVRSNAFTVTG